MEIDELLSKAVLAYDALQKAENDLYSLVKKVDGTEGAEEIDEKLLDDIRDLVFNAWDAVGDPPLSDDDVEEIELMLLCFLEGRVDRKARAAGGTGG